MAWAISLQEGCVIVDWDSHHPASLSDRAKIFHCHSIHNHQVILLRAHHGAMKSSFDDEKPSDDGSSYTLLNDDMQKSNHSTCQAWPRRFLIMNGVGLMLNLALLSVLSFVALSRPTPPFPLVEPEANQEVVLRSHGTMGGDTSIAISLIVARLHKASDQVRA